MSTFSYFPHTEDDIKEMLQRIGVSSLDDLYSDVPAEFIFKGQYDLPDAMSEQQTAEPGQINVKKMTEYMPGKIANQEKELPPCGRGLLHPPPVAVPGNSVERAQRQKAAVLYHR